MDKLLQLINDCWIVLGQMSPYLILGFLVSGVLSVFISPGWAEQHLGTGKAGSVVKATLLGVPLPLCSCGVIPVAASLRRHGASKGATTAFLISTPQTGVDSIMATWGLLGPFFAVFRPLAALITGIFGGLVVSATDPEDMTRISSTVSQKIDTASLTIGEKVQAALRYAFLTLPSEIAKALIIGIVIAGLLSTFLSGDTIAAWIGNYHVTMLIMLAIGIPVYVCSTSSIPIALAFIKMGVSPGAAFVFLISGPATNAAAISVVWKILGRASAAIYIATVIFGSLAGGYALDLFAQRFSEAGLNAITPACHTELSMLEIGSAIFMMVVMLFSTIKSREQSSECSACSSCSGVDQNNPAGESISVAVEGMSCGKCAEAVKNALLEIPGVVGANVMLSEKLAMVSGHGVNPETVVNTINSLGYTATKK